MPLSDPQVAPVRQATCPLAFVLPVLHTQEGPRRVPGGPQRGGPPCPQPEACSALLVWSPITADGSLFIRDSFCLGGTVPRAVNKA